MAAYEKYNINDLVNLPELNEMTILETLKERYNKDNIYTYNGPILIAVNPYYQIKDLYGTDKIKQFINKENNEPHVYGIAERALNALKISNKSQTILASGESGSGKTVTTKLLLNHIAICNKSNNNLEQKILSSNQILESFGNAKTVRNNNSSRFGKFIKLYFENNSLVGASIDTYLLEKIRVIKQGKRERNFHIFYQMYYGMSKSSKKIIKLQEIEEYQILNHKNITKEEQDQFNKEFELLMQAFELFEFENTSDIFKLLSGLLALGNVVFEPVNGGNEVSSLKDEWWDLATELLNIDSIKLDQLLTTKKIKAGKEVITKNLNNNQAITSRDTIIQELYLIIFNVVTSQINQQIKGRQTNLFVGILDIFGFEIFERNGLEQLHINYTNEYLQKQFNEHIFELEQKEYTKEGIDWNSIEFPDNTHRLDAIHGKTKSLISILDDHCLVNGDDHRVYENYKSLESDIIKFSSIDNHKLRFDFEHYAGNVKYTTKDFINKNKLFFNDEIEEFKKIFYDRFKLKNTTDKSKTLSSQFKKQLNDLIKLIKSTHPHYVRCIKPNDEDLRHTFNDERIGMQLRYSGVLEAVKVARAGYPIRFYHREFNQRYFMIKNLNDQIKDKFNKLIQIGNTKMFLKRKPYQHLENERTLMMINSSIKIQSHIRKYLALSRYQKIKLNIIYLQSILRMFLAISKRLILLINKKSKIITKFMLMVPNRRLYRKKLSSIKHIQRYYKLYKFKKYLNNSINEKKTIKIQSWFRMITNKNRYQIRIKKIRHERSNNIGLLNDRISKMEKELSMMKTMREYLDDKEKEIKYHREKLEDKNKEIEYHLKKVKEKDQVSGELCGKMSSLIVENHELKELLKQYQDREKENKKKGFFASLFG